MNVKDVAFVSTLLLLLLTISGDASEFNQDLVFVLQELFMSDVVLIARNEENSDEYVRKFYKLHNFKAFVGTINMNDYFLVQNFKKKMMRPYQNMMIVSDFSIKFFQKLTNFNMPVIWVIFCNGEVPDDIKKFYIPYNSRFFLVKKINNFEYEITDVYQISENSPQITSVFGNFKQGNLEITSNNFYNRRRDLNGHKFNVSVSFVPDYIKKFGYLWELFSKGMNFTVVSNPFVPGTIEPNGTTTGLFKLLENHELDGTASNLVVTNQRLDVLDCIFPTLISEARLYMNVQAELNWTSYIAPFSLLVWISIASWTILTAIALHIIIRFKKNNEKRFIDSLFDIMQALCYQGVNFNVSSLALYILYLMPYLLAIILVQYYSGELLSELTVQKVCTPFKNLKEAIEDGRYKVTTMKNAFYETYYRTNDGYEATALRERGLLESPENMPATVSAGYHQLCEGRYIYICASVIDFTVKKDCRITELKTIAFYESWGILVWKGFPFKNDMIKLMRQLQFSGLVKLRQNNIIIPKEEAADFQPLTIELIFPIFILHLVVILLCGAILLCEIFWKNFKVGVTNSRRKFY